MHIFKAFPPVVALVAIACMLVLSTSTEVRGQGGQDTASGDRELDCAAALAGVALAFKLNDPDKLPPVMADLETWMARLGKSRQGEVVPHFRKMDAQYGSRWSIDTAMSCRNELHAATPAQCLKVVKEQQDQAVWYFKAASGQAALGRATGGHIDYALQDIRQGCKHIDYARAKLHEMNCPAEIKEVMEETWRNYVLDVPGPKGSARLACLGNGN